MLMAGDAASGARPGDDLVVSVKLPQIRRMAKLDGQIVRVDRVDGQAVWAIRLLDPPPTIVEGLKDLVEGRAVETARGAGVRFSKPVKKVEQTTVGSRPHHGEEVFREVDGSDEAPADPMIPPPLSD